MINKIYKSIKNHFKTFYILYIGLILSIILNFVTFDYNIYSPGSLEDLTNRIKVEDSYPQEGSFNLTYVTSRHGSIINILLSYILPSWDLISLDNSRIENESSKEILNRDKIYLKETSYDAIIAAFNEAGLPYDLKNVDLSVSYVFELADTNIEIGDIIKNINGKEVNSFEELSNQISTYNTHDKIEIKVLRNDKVIDCYAVIKEEDNRKIIGISLVELKNIETTPEVEYIFKDNESGASRGLMCALDIYNKITEYDLTKGKIISGTGSIDENGVVGAIDGVKYKLKGAVKNNADVFIVPTYNYPEAIKLKEENNYDIEIIEADNLHNVIEKLKKL